METLRRLRNQTRKFMTGRTTAITPKQQAAWWAAGERRAWLFIEGDRVIGFAHVRRDDGVNWITLGVDKAERGKGYGTVIYRSFPGTYARIKADNEASVRAAAKAGYVPVIKEDDAVVMASFHS